MIERLSRFVWSRSSSASKAIHRSFQSAKLLVIIALISIVGCGSKEESQKTSGAAGGDARTASTNHSSTSVVGSSSGGINPSKMSFRFVDARGIEEAVVNNGAKGDFTLPESIGSGLGVIDFDSDGKIDICVAGGGESDVATRVIRGFSGSLLQSLGDFQFRPVLKSAWLDFSLTNNVGIIANDYNSDGYCDLLVTGYSGLQLFRNQGDGTFEFATQEAGLTDELWSSSAAFFDADNDGDLDLYVVHYANWSFENHPKCPSHYKHEFRDYCGPREYAGLPDRFYENLGDGTFRPKEDFAPSSLAYRGLGVLAADLDGDGDVDLYVANDVDPNLLFRNEGALLFQEMGVRAGVAVDDQGRPEGSMGIALGDYNLDRKYDLFVTNYQNELCALYRGVEKLSFAYATRSAKISNTDELSVSWGTAFSDFDLDGDEDIVVVNGHIESYSPGSEFKQRGQILENESGKWFRLARGKDNEFQSVSKAARGLALADLNDDGRMDFVSSNLGEPISIVENKTETKGRYLKVRLKGVDSNRDAIGANLELTIGDKSWVRQIYGGGSYASTNDRIAHFGMDESSSESGLLTIRWPSGSVQKVVIEKLDVELLVIEGN